MKVMQKYILSVMLDYINSMEICIFRSDAGKEKQKIAVTDSPRKNIGYQCHVLTRAKKALNMNSIKKTDHDYCNR